MILKLELLKNYIEAQMEDHELWIKCTTPTESYMQQELHKLAWLIEEAGEDEILLEIEKYAAHEASGNIISKPMAKE